MEILDAKLRVIVVVLEIAEKKTRGRLRARIIMYIDSQKAFMTI